MSTAAFSPRLTQEVQDRMARRIYRSVEELLLAALEALDQQEALDESIAASLADEAAGRVHPAEGLADRIRTRAQERRGN